jgi:hypothetical protein
VRAGDTPLGAWGPGAPDPAKTEIADYDLSAISVAAKPRTAIVMNITVVTGMCLRNSAISFPRCKFPTPEELRNRDRLQHCPKNDGLSEDIACDGGHSFRCRDAVEW